MKLSQIPGIEPTVKHSFSLKRSTIQMLQAYHSAYCSQAGVDVAFKDVVEQMLLDFMRDDKSFQRSLKAGVTVTTTSNPEAILQAVPDRVSSYAPTSSLDPSTTE